MSLSEQFQRVDGSQNDILRALAQSYGINTSGLKIDQLAAAVKASKKFKQDGLLSTSTAKLLGLGTDATPDDAFNKIYINVGERLKIVKGSYVGDGTYGQGRKSELTFESSPKLLFFYSGDSDTHNIVVYLEDGVETISITFQDTYASTFLLSENTVSWYTTQSRPEAQLNYEGRTYYYAALL